jgi:hypothetical protein
MLENNLETDVTIFIFKVYYSGWEVDYEGYVKQTKDGKNYIVLTDHGAKYVAKPEELRDLINEYENAITDTKNALMLVEEI